jgi:saccharopine dehydrogenase (NAD+, L-glutamate forming)
VLSSASGRRILHALFAMTHDRKLDIVLYGATGFTGGLVADYLARAREQQPLRWALAGRNLDKLQAVLRRLPAGAGATPPQLIVAEASDPASLARMAEGARVVITTVGPYGKYGEPLVRACAEAGTDYVDLAGEPEFVASMGERYHEQAAHNGARIVHACGFDSIPHDLGAYYTVHALRARLPAEQREHTAVTIDGFVRTRGSFSGGTWHSALEIMSGMRAHARAQRRRAAARPPSERRAVHVQKPPVFRRDLGFWAVPMPTIDPMIVVRSAELLPEYGPDFRYGHYMGIKRAYQVAGLFAGVGTVFALAQVEPTKKLLQKLKHPGEGPDEKTRRSSYFQVIFLGQAGAEHVRCEVRGGDPGYGETAKMLAESALCLSFDRARLPARTGVITSAAAMGEQLIARLQRAGISFRETTAP